MDKEAAAVSDTVFTQVQYSLGTLISQIEMGSIGLPDIQRPFVWESAKVRDLFDSMYRGYPVGHLLLWESGAVVRRETNRDWRQATRPKSPHRRRATTTDVALCGDEGAAGRREGLP